MSTRAIYIFKDKDEQYTVYKHHDGYPKGAAQWLTVARHLSWPGGQFEPDEAAASFVTAAKLASKLNVTDDKLVFDCEAANRYPHGGGVRLMNVSKKKGLFDKAPSDTEFAYIIENRHGDWYITAYTASFWDAAKSENATEIWQGPLKGMSDWAATYEG